MKIIQSFGVLVLVGLMLLVSAEVVVAAENDSLFLIGGDRYQRDGVMPFSSEQDVVIGVEGNIAGDISVDVYDASIDDVLEFLVYEEKKDEYGAAARVQRVDVPVKRGEPTATISVKNNDSFVVPMSKTGIRLLHARGGSREVYAFVVRSDIGVLARSGGDNLIFWAQNLGTKRSASGVQIDVYSLKDKLRKKSSAKTGVDGVAKTEIDKSYDLAVARIGGSSAIVPINLQSLGSSFGFWNMAEFDKNKPQTKHFLFTDRTLYKPGDLMYFKSIVRQDDDIRYSIASGKWDAQVVYGWGNDEVIVANQEVETNEYGSLSGELRLPTDVKTGDYKLRLRKIGGGIKDETSFFSNDVEVYFQVEHYRKPAQTISVKLDQGELVNSQSITAQIEGKYFSGEPLADERIEYTVYVEDFYESDFYADFADRKNWFQYYGVGGEEMSDSVILDANGKATINIPTNITNGKTAVYAVEISYKPKQGEPVVDLEKSLVYAGEYGIYRTDYRYSFKTGESAKIKLKLQKNTPEAVVANQRLQVAQKYTWWEKNIQRKNGRHWYDYQRQEKNLPDVSFVTNDNGEVVLDLGSLQSGSYTLSVNMIDRQRNNIKKEFGIWVYDANNNSNYKSSLNIVMVDDKVAPGDKASFDIISDVPNTDIFVSISRKFVQDYKVVSLRGNTGSVQFDMRDSYMPKVKLTANSFDGERFDEAQVDVAVNTDAQKLVLEVSTDKLRYAPGEKVTLNVIARDAQGHPQQADIAVWAVDKAIFELADPSASDIFAKFWDWRWGWSSITHSFRGITVRMAEGGGCFVGETLVTMADGSQKQIKDVQIGESVLTRTNPDDAQLVAAKVVGTHVTQVDGFLIINDDLRVTPEHLLFVNGEWQRADSVEIGDTLIGLDDKEVAVSSLQWQAQNVTVYNLNVQNQHTYFAGGVFVHNGKGAGAGRSIFKDTAYWNSKVITGADGRATVSFTLPDDLTTWSIAAIGATAETKVGSAIAEVEVGKKYILRPSLPSVVRAGDVVHFATNVQNLSNKKQEFVLDLAVGDEGEVDRGKRVTIGAGERKVVSWQIDTVGIGSESVSQLGLTFSMYSADGTNLLDRITKQVPIEKFGFWETRSFAGYGVRIPYKLDIPTDAQNDKLQINLTTSATLLGSLSGAAKYLIHYPYGCMEQTVSRFIPALLAKEQPAIFGSVVTGQDIDAMIVRGVERLAKHQNSDGGWSWWSDDVSDKFISLYVSEYLLRAQDLGFDVGDTLAGAEQYFVGSQPESNVVRSVLRRAGIAFFQAEFNKAIVSDKEGFSSGVRNNNLIKVHESMPLDVVAMGVMANVRQGFDNPGINGVQVLRKMLERANGRTWWVNGDQSKFGARNTPSAMALRAFIVGGGDMATARKVVWTLRDLRTQEQWYNTFATAQIFEAFTQFAKLEQEQISSTGVTMEIDGVSYKDFAFDNDNFTNSIKISLKDILAKQELVVASKNEAPIYSTLFMRMFRTDRNARAVSNGMTLSRTYANADPAKKVINIGDTVEITLNVGGLEKDERYLVIEDQLPAGLVVLNENLKNLTQKDRDVESEYAHIEYTKNGAIMSREYIKAGAHTFRYLARVVSLGEFIAPPATASLMYSPDIYARTAVATVRISDKSGLKYDGASGVVGSVGNFAQNYGSWIAGALVVLAGIIVYTKLWRRRASK